MTINELKSLLHHYGLKPNITMGQNFLMDDQVLNNIISSSNLTKEDVVLEIGPGIGNLTSKLCEKAGAVFSVEKDFHFVPVLEDLKRKYKNFNYVIADALKYLSLLPSPLREKVSEGRMRGNFKVVANIPYYLTGKIIQTLIRLNPKPKSITLLIQKEVAENLAAQKGEYNLLAISVQLFADVKIITKVGKEKFYPAPKVDSALIQIVPFDVPLLRQGFGGQARYDIKDEKKLFRILKACFVGKRKQIHNTLTNNLHLPKEKVLEVLQKLKINPALRPQDLALEDWINLAEKLF